jgi:hypothetical protein
MSHTSYSPPTMLSTDPNFINNTKNLSIPISPQMNNLGTPYSSFSAPSSPNIYPSPILSPKGSPIIPNGGSSGSPAVPKHSVHFGTNGNASPFSMPKQHPHPMLMKQISSSTPTSPTIRSDNYRSPQSSPLLNHRGGPAMLVEGNPFLKSPKQNKHRFLIKGYSLDRTVGKGSFCKVKLATHNLTGDKVAVKIIQKQKLDAETIKMVQQEIYIMKLLHHPNIITLYEVQETENYIYVIMEYASGGEIMDFFVAHGRLQEDRARKFYRQIIAAVK